MLRKLLSEISKLGIRAQDDDAGKIDDVYFDDHKWVIRYFVVNTGSWLLGRRVLIAPAAVERPDWEQHVLRVNLTKEQVDNSPDINLTQPVSRQQLVDLHQYYGWPTFWDMDPMMGGAYPIDWTRPQPLAVNEEAPAEPGRTKTNETSPTQKQKDPHLRSAHEVKNYHIQAEDGEFGYVEDFFVSDDEWIVRYLLIDSHRWLPGRMFLIAPDWIDSINWSESEVKVTLPRQRIQDSPEYAPHQTVQRDYEAKLYEYYGVPGYWEDQLENTTASQVHL
jgi:hypothetical protein